MYKGKRALTFLLAVSLVLSTMPSDVQAAAVTEEASVKITAGDTNAPVNIGEGSVASGLYAEWKNTAITYPEKGQLVAAGYMDTEFNRLEGAVQYDVYVDGNLIKTFEGEAAKAETYEAEFKNVEVKKHTTYVVATMENGKTVTSNIRTFFVSKKGMGIWQDDADKIKELNLSWYYTWSPNELEGVSDQVDFVPMVWGDDTGVGDRQAEWNWLRNGGWKDYRYLLTFNEPDFTDQSNVTPERAVELWKDIQPLVEDGTIDVGSPVVAIPTVFYPDEKNAWNTVGGWYGKYEQLMAAAEYYDEFTTVHFYFDYPGDWILETLEKIHETTGKPLWITEWGVGQWSQVQDFDWLGGPDEGNWQRDIIVEFVNEIIPQLDQLDYVERYAWFPFDGSNTEKFGNGAGGLFFSGANDPLKGQLTAVGKAYKSVGNPIGWDPDKITEDQVVIDGEDDKEEESGGTNPGEDDKKDESSNTPERDDKKDGDSTNPGNDSGKTDGITGGNSENPGDTVEPAYATFKNGKLYYRVTKIAGDTGEVQVIKPLKKTEKKLAIPATVIYHNKVFKVTSIAKNAFKNNKKLKSVTIGGNVTMIRARAFYGCKKMTGVTMGKNVRNIGKEAFYNCTKLTKVTFKGAKVKKIGAKAFVKTNKKIKFKVGKKNIKRYTNLLKKKAPGTAKITK